MCIVMNPFLILTIPYGGRCVCVCVCVRARVRAGMGGGGGEGRGGRAVLRVATKVCPREYIRDFLINSRGSLPVCSNNKAAPAIVHLLLGLQLSDRVGRNSERHDAKMTVRTEKKRRRKREGETKATSPVTPPVTDSVCCLPGWVAGGGHAFTVNQSCT